METINVKSKRNGRRNKKTNTPRIPKKQMNI